MNRIPSIAAFILSVTTTASSGESHNINASFANYSLAAKVFALSEANSAAYQLRLLTTGQVASQLKPNLDIFEMYFTSLPKEERLKLALLILVNYNFDGEYAERFDLMTNSIRRDFASWIQKLDRQRLRDFVTGYHREWKPFVEKCLVHFDVRL